MMNKDRDIPPTVKHQNRRIVLEIMRSGEPFTVSQIAGQARLSRQTVTKALEHFQHQGLITSRGKGDSSEAGGKRPGIYAFHSPHCFLCVLLRKSELRIYLMDINMDKLDYLETALPHGCGFDEMIELLGKGCNQLLERNSDADKRLFGISISTPGIIEEQSGILRLNVYHGNWGQNLPLKERVRGLFPSIADIIVENDGRMTGYAHLWDDDMDFGGKRVAAIYTEEGVSACFIHNGSIQNGANSLMGEIGHITLDPDDDEVCACGSRGCFERLVNIGRVRQRMARDFSEFGYPSGGYDLASLSFNDLFEGSDKSITLFVRESKRLARYFAQLLRCIYVIYDPDIILFQGNFSKADQQFKATLDEAIKEFKYLPNHNHCRLIYDTRDLYMLEALGSTKRLISSYLNRTALGDG